MTKTEKSRPRRQPEAGRTETATGKAHNSCNHFSMDGPQRQRLSSFLRLGKSSATPGRELAEQMGLGDLRELTRLVERERAAGCPIGATCDSRGPGYYLCNGPEELSAYIKALDRRLRNVRKTRSRLADTLERMTGQRGLF